jgi:hypothetical protein
MRMRILHKLSRFALPVFAVLCLGAAGVIAFRTYSTPTPRLLRLVDGTEVFYLSDTLVRPSSAYPALRELKIDGEAFVRATEGTQPLMIRTRLMVLKVTGVAALRVTARSHETGEEADVLAGQVEATKAYHSPQNEPDTLSAGEEVMVNETIDLQEKETADMPGLRSWSQALMASVRAQGSR